MLFRVKETRELKKLNFTMSGEECAAEIIGSYLFDEFIEEDGVLVCSQEVFHKEKKYFSALQIAEDKLDKFREENGFIDEIEHKILDLVDITSFFEYPKALKEFIEKQEVSK